MRVKEAYPPVAAGFLWSFVGQRSSPQIFAVLPRAVQYDNSSIDDAVRSRLASRLLHARTPHVVERFGRYASLLSTAWKRHGYPAKRSRFLTLDHKHHIGNHSWRSATTGSTRVARNAGKKQAAKPNATTTKAPASRETGSRAFRVHS